MTTRDRKAQRSHLLSHLHSEAEILSILGFSASIHAFIVTHKRTINMAYIRAREVEQEIRDRGHERGTVYVLQVLAEQMIAQQRDMKDLADSVNMMADIIKSVVTVGENMKMTIDRLNSDMRDDDMDRNTFQLGGGDKNG
jgi:hypothetical protein